MRCTFKTQRKRTARQLVVCALAVATLTSCFELKSLNSGPPKNLVTDWRNEVIYQVLTDRFANGDQRNDFNIDTTNLTAYHGGDWQGLIEKLDYIQGLGVTTLWISPVVKNVESDAGISGSWRSSRTLASAR